MSLPGTVVPLRLKVLLLVVLLIPALISAEDKTWYRSIRFWPPKRDIGKMKTAPVQTLPVSLGACTFDGSLAEPFTETILAGAGRLRTVLLPPHDLIITWPSSVSFNVQRIEWDSAEKFAGHYGLEYWNDDESAYRLVYEEMTNSTENSLHTFAMVNTHRVRFTVYTHPVAYDGLIISNLTFWFQPSAPSNKYDE